MIAPADPRPGRVVTFGEVLLRLAAPRGELLLQSNLLVPCFCGAEANVAVALAGFGHDVQMVTALPDNMLGQAARQSLRGFGVALAAEAIPASRLGLYFLQPGAMTRPATVTYDRACSAFALHDASRYDWDALLDGADWLFISGITAALGDQPLASLRAAARAARAAGVRIAFDTNFRPALWQGREAEASAILCELACTADLVFAGRRAVAMMTGGDYSGDSPVNGFSDAARNMFALAPHLRHVASTRREVFSSDRQILTGFLASRDALSVSAPVTLENIVDRVGTGDAFAAGILHGLMAGRDGIEALEFAVRSCEWAHSVPGDLLRAGVADIVALGGGASDVRR